MIAKPRQFGDSFLLVLLGVSLAGNVYVAYRFASPSSKSSSPPLLAIGAAVSPAVAYSPDGRVERLEYQSAGRPTVIYVSAPGCQWCERNRSSIEALIVARKATFRFVALSLSDDVDPYLAQRNIDGLTLLSRPSSETRKEYMLGPTPHTMVIGPDGRVVQNWLGAYSGKTRRDVEAYFNVSLSEPDPTGSPSVTTDPGKAVRGRGFQNQR
jgi:hypothetical protein